MTDPTFLPPRDSDDEAAIVAQVEAVLGFALPGAMRAGVVVNVKLLEQHWAVLRKASE